TLPGRRHVAGPRDLLCQARALLVLEACEAKQGLQLIEVHLMRVPVFDHRDLPTRRDRGRIGKLTRRALSFAATTQETAPQFPRRETCVFHRTFAPRSAPRQRCSPSPRAPRPAWSLWWSSPGSLFSAASSGARSAPTSG